MDRPLHRIRVLAAAIVAAAGCSSSPWSASSPKGQPLQPQAAATPAQPSAGEAAASPDTSEQKSPTRGQIQALQEVMAELQQAGALDQASQEKLIADLRQTDPALWPLLVQQFRAAAAYRRRAQEQEMAAAPGDPVPPAPSKAVVAGPVDRVGRLPAANDAALPPQETPPGDYPSTDRPAVEAHTSNRPLADRASGPSGGVVNASYESAAPGDWRAQVACATQQLESQLEGKPAAPEEVARHAQLRMLYLLAGRRDDALRPIPAQASATQDFWSKQLYGLATWLDTQRNPDAVRRAAETKQILEEAVARLGETAPLVVRNLAFCTRIHSYGCIERFKTNDFTPDQEVLLYAEVENFASESTAKGYHTALRSSYQIFDSRGQRVAEQNFAQTEEYCQNPRRDFFIGFHLRLPKRIYPGKHTLQLTIEDLKGHKVGQSSIEFTAKEGEDR